MRHYQPQWISMIWREWLAIVMSSEQNVFAIQIRQRNVCSIALLRMYQHIAGFWLGFNASEDLAHGHASPAVIEAAPAGNAVEVAGSFNAGQLIEFLPCEAERMLENSRD